MKRKEILEKAAQYTTTDRETQYGSPENNFALIAEYWRVYKGVEFSAHDVGVMMALLKIARIQSGQRKDDNYIDLAGYAACAGEIATQINSYLPEDYEERMRTIEAVGLNVVQFDQFGNVVRNDALKE